jgi:hypothetical protein
LQSAAPQTDPQGMRRQQLMGQLSTSGGVLVQNIVLGISGKTPWRSVKDGDFSMASLLFEIGNFDVNVLNQLLQFGLTQLSETYARSDEKSLFHQKIMACYASTTSSKSIVSSAICGVVGRFGNLTRQNYGKFRRKEMAAKHAEMAKIR